MAARARLLDRKEALLHAYLAMALAGRTGAGRGTGFRAAAVAGLARFHGRNPDPRLGSTRRVLETDLEVVAEICAPINVGTRSTPAEYVAEDIADQVRLMYVGMTRARSKLLLTASATTVFTQRLVEIVAP